MGFNLRDLTDPETRKFLENKKDKATGKPVLQIALEASKKHYSKVNADLDRSEKKTNKYGNKRVKFEGINFDSQKEVDRYCELKILERGKKISELKYHVVYKLEVNGVLICKYEPDFQYLENGKLVVEDVKSAYFMKQNGDPVYKLYKAKKQLMLALFQIDVREIVY